MPQVISPPVGTADSAVLLPESEPPPPHALSRATKATEAALSASLCELVLFGREMCVFIGAQSYRAIRKTDVTLITFLQIFAAYVVETTRHCA
jgi:hypothetical protein